MSYSEMVSAFLQSPLVQGQVRHFITVAAGYLISAGAIDKGDESSFTKIMTGIAMWVIVAGWSWWDKRGRAKVVEGLKKLTATKTAKDAVTASQVLPPAAAVDTAAKSASVKSVTNVLIAAFMLSLFLASSAHAQIKKPQLTGDVVADTKANLGFDRTPAAPKLTGNIEKDAQAVWKKIVDASLTDLGYASALAASAKTNAGNVRKQCYDAIITLNKQVNGADLKNPDGSPMVKPDPALFTDVEILAETIDNLSPQGALFTSCAGAAQLAKTGVLQFINAAVAGAAGMAALPVIPGL